MLRLIKKKQFRHITLREHYERRNRVLIKRRAGGVGDILMQRMMMEDMSSSFEGIDLNYACPKSFEFFAANNPFVKTLALEEIDERSFGIIYDITTVCRVHEMRYAGENRTHRSDIWSKFCGVTLKKHNMQLKFDDDSLADKYKSLIAERNQLSLPTVLFVPHSQNDSFGIAKSLTDEQIAGVVRYLNATDHKVFTIHNRNLDVFSSLGVDQFVGLPGEQWIYMAKAADYIITVDTATFHIGGGLKKPMVGVFTFTDGKVYGKYYEFILVQNHRDNGWDCGPCYTMNCHKSNEPRKPCCTELTARDILKGFDMARERWPVRNQSQSLPS